MNYRVLVDVARLPKRPETIFVPDETLSDNPALGVDADHALVIAGISVVGDSLYVCRSVTIMVANDPTNPEGCSLRGWSLFLGLPNSVEELYYFDTAEKTQRGTELPNYKVYFSAAVPASLAEKDAAHALLNEIVAYALPFIADREPPPPAEGDSEWPI